MRKNRHWPAARQRTCRAFCRMLLWDVVSARDGLTSCAESRGEFADSTKKPRHPLGSGLGSGVGEIRMYMHVDIRPPELALETTPARARKRTCRRLWLIVRSQGT
jgi:hypothetical protein